MDAPQPQPVEHTHVHHWADHVDRSFTHAHAMPSTGRSMPAARPHDHADGRHSHPHGHEEYPE